MIARTTIVHAVRRRAALAMVRAGARLLGAQTGARLGTGRIIRQSDPGTGEIGADGLDHPVRLGFGPDGALYLTYPSVEPGPNERQGALLRIDLFGQVGSRSYGPLPTPDTTW